MAKQDSCPVPCAELSNSNLNTLCTTVREHGTEKPDSRPVDSASQKVVRNLKGIRWVVVVTAILSSTFLYALDNTIVANIRPSIIQTLGEIEKLPWVSVAYAAGEVGSNPFWYSNPPREWVGTCFE